MQRLEGKTECLYPKKEDFFTSFARHAPVSLFTIRAKECELFSHYVYERPMLDVGCGEGIFVNALFDVPIDAGIDVEQRNVEKARQLNSYKEVYCAPAEKLPFNDSHFKTVISNCVLEHVQDIDKALCEIHRVLVPGGRAYLSVATPLFSEAMSATDIIFNKFGIKIKAGIKLMDYLFRHNRTLYLNEWKKKIVRAGFIIREIHPYLSAQLLNLMGFFLVFSVDSFIWKKTINRWSLFPQLNRPKAVMNFVRRCYDKESKENGCIFFVVSKEEKL